MASAHRAMRCSYTSRTARRPITCRTARDEWSHHGDAATDGLIPRAVQYMYQSLARRTAEQRTKFTVRCSFCEIYNEKVCGGGHACAYRLLRGSGRDLCDVC